MTKKSGWDSSENEVQSNWVKFNVPLEDKIFGTLIEKRSVTSTMKDKEGQKSMAYDIKADEGSYHTLDDKKKVVEPAVEVVADGIYSVGGTNVIDRQMKNIRIGQKIGLKYIEDQPSKTKGWSPAKIIKVYAPKNEEGTGPLMDEPFMTQYELDHFSDK